jgi:hypothetical protein
MQKCCTVGRVIMAVCLIVCSWANGWAQDRCGIVDIMQNLRSNKRSIRESDEQFEQWLKQRKVNAAARTGVEEKFYIPVVVHVIHRGEAVGTGTNISDAQIISQIKVLNNDFNRLNADASNTPSEFQSVAGSLNIEFVLAKQDPDGDETTGIVRVKGSRTSWSTSNDGALKATSYWPAEDYLNVWVTNLSSTLLGYAQFPVSDLAGLEDADDNRLTDGVVIDYLVFGSSDDGSFDLDDDFDKGRTTTHEVGHYLGLRHIWGDDGGACGGDGDYVSDTPDQSEESSGCLTHPQTTCGVHKMFQNYMDYTDDACMNMFTQDQVGRMITVMENSPRRKTLPASKGLEEPDNTSIKDIALVKITEPSPVRCEESATPVIVIRNNGNVNVTSLQITYSINSGTETTVSKTDITDFAPGTEISVPLSTVNFSADENILTVSVSKPNGYTDKNASDNELSKTVVVNTASDIIPLRQNFDASFADQWTLVNPSGGMNWQTITTNYNQSLYFNAAANEIEGDAAWLVSPVLDFSAATTASVFFDLSYRYLSSDGNRNDLDNLQVLASTDCGVTYDKVLFNETGTALSVSDDAVNSTPTKAEDWNRNYVKLTDFAGKSNVRLAFVFTNDNGNNIYIDNIEFFVSDDPNPNSVNNPFVVYDSDPITPSDFYITFNLTERQPVQYELTDMMGRQVVAQQLDDVLNQTYEVNAEHTSTGIYFLRLQIGQNYYTTKVYVGK